MNLFDAHSIVTDLGLIGILAIIFAETGLLIGLAFPGDSLLFIAGIAASGTGAALLNGNQLPTAELFIGAPIAGLKSFLAIPEENRKGDQLPGIPVMDSTNNELVTWLQLVNESYAGAKMDLLLKGDNVSKYPSFRNVITALKKNDILKFQMITNPENAPMGSELWKKSMSGEKQEN